MNNQLLTASGVIFDVVVCTFFAWRLMLKYRDDPTNIFIKYFIVFFWIFDLFLLLTLFYIPGFIISKDSFLIQIAFNMAFFLLYILAAYAAKIVIVVKFPNLARDYFFWPLIIFGSIAAVFFTFFFQPTAFASKNGYSLELSIPQTILMAVPVSIAYLSAAYIFLQQAIKDKVGRMRSSLLALAFILWIIGGATHPLTLKMGITLVSDIITSLGFIAAFIALIKSPNNN